MNTPAAQSIWNMNTTSLRRSDRLAIAREVDHKLTKIYANLVLIEKWLHGKQTVESFLKGKLNGLFEYTGWQMRHGSAAFSRWRESTYKAINNEKNKKNNKKN